MTNPSTEREIRIDPLQDIPQFLKPLSEAIIEAFHVYMPDQTLEERIEQMQSRMVLDPVPRCFIAHRDDEFLGTASVLAKDLMTWPEPEPWLATVVVPPKHQGKGYGYAVCKHVTDYMGTLGHRKALLYTWTKRAFFESWGWRHVERQDLEGRSIDVMEYEFGQEKN